MIFIPVSIALIPSPRPDFIYVLSQSVNGISIGLFYSAGILTGVGIHITGAILGLSRVLWNPALVRLIIMYVGTAYLLSLGIHEFRSKGPIEIVDEHSEPTITECYLRGVLVTC